MPSLVTSGTSEPCQSAGAQTLHPTGAGGTEGAGEELTQPTKKRRKMLEEDAPRKSAVLGDGSLEALQSWGCLTA